MRWLVLWAVLLGTFARAQVPDAGLPDAAVGEGGADRDNEENDRGGFCAGDRDCQGAMGCVQGRCQPRPVVEVGCAVLPAAPLWALLLLGLSARRCPARRGTPRAR